MNGFADPHFWQLWGVGLLGFVLWILTTFADPQDDRLTGTLWRALWSHSRTTALALIAHLVMAIVFWEMQQLNIVASVASGYGSQSIVFKVLGARLAKVSGAADDGKDGGK